MKITMDFNLKHGTIALAMIKSMTPKQIEEKYTPEEIVQQCFMFSAKNYGFEHMKILSDKK